MKTLVTLLASILAFQAHAFELAPDRAAKCRAQLQTSVCYSDPIPHWYETKGEPLKDALVKYQNRKCAPAPQEYMSTLLRLYDSYPDVVKSAFCEIKRVFIVKGDVNFGARTEYFFKEDDLRAIPNSLGTIAFRGTATGYVLEISETNRLLRKEDSGQYETRVTQGRFGRNTLTSGVSDQLPVARHQTPFGSSGALATTIVHEIGHMLSRAHRATDIFFMPASPTAWSDLSWSIVANDHAEPKSVDVDRWKRLTGKKLALTEVSEANDLLKIAGFSSYYAASNPEEDFAETFMFNFYGDFTISHGGSDIVDLKRDFETNPILKAKLEYIRGLLDSPNPFSLTDTSVVSGFVAR